MYSCQPRQRIFIQMVVSDNQPNAFTASSTQKEGLQNERMQFGRLPEQYEDFGGNGNTFRIERSEHGGRLAISCGHALPIPHAQHFVYPEKPVQKGIDRTETRGGQKVSLYREHGTREGQSAFSRCDL